MTSERDPKSDVRVLREKNCPAVTVVWRHFVDHRLVHVVQVLHNRVRRHRLKTIARRNVLLHGASATGKRIAMVRLASIAAPVTEKLSSNHVLRMITGNLAGQIVERQPVETCTSALCVDHSEKLLAGEWDVVLIE